MFLQDYNNQKAGVYNQLRIMYENQQISAKRSEFRNLIRRRQIQQHFHIQRMKYAQSLVRDQQEQILRQLDSPQKKRQWIYKKAIEFGNQPNKGWYQIMRELSISTGAFNNGDFNDWIDAGIVKYLVKLFKQQYKQLGLSELSACVMQDIFYYLPSQGPQIQRIFQQEFVLDLVQLCADPNIQTEYYYQLIYTIIENRYYLRNIFIDKGIVQILSQRLKSYKDYESDQVYCALSLVYRLVKNYQVKGIQNIPKGNVTSIFIPILDTCLGIIRNQETIRVILKCFSSLAIIQKQYIISNLFQSPNLINYLLHIISIQGNPTNRTLAAGIIASILTSEKLTYAQELLRRNVLDNILICSKMKNNHQQCIESILKIISNISVNTLDDARKIIGHQIFCDFVMPQANQLQNLKNHENAIYILCSLLQFKNFQITETLLKKFSILQTFIQSLSANFPTLNNCLQVLSALYGLIKMYDQIFTGHTNKITADLQRIYNIQNVLKVLQQKIQNKRVLQRIDMLIEAMNSQ